MSRQPSSTCLDLIYASTFEALLNLLLHCTGSQAHSMRVCGVRRTDKNTNTPSFLSSHFLHFAEYAKAFGLVLYFTMSLRSLFLCTLLLRFHPIFGPHVLAASDAAGKINLYDDYDCIHPSTLNPSVTLPLSTCLVTTGGEGLVIAELPPCPQSTATLIYYQDTACGVQTDVSTGISAENCFQLADGTDLYNARSVMFSCSPAANNLQPSSTTTAVVSALAAVATGSTESNGSESSTSAAGSTPTDTITQKNSTSSSGSNSSGGASTSTNPGSGSGLDTGDIIALAVGLGIGIPTILVMLATWLFPDFRHTVRRWFSGGLDQLDQWAFPRNNVHQWHYNGTQQMYSQQQPYHRY